jgi:undecaprenyl diphosphate synthase
MEMKSESDRAAAAPSLPLFLQEDFEMQSTPKNVAIIMDGNRRWARARGLPAVAGHRAGARALEALLPALGRTGIQTLTLFGFSAANWQRSRFEVEHLLELLESHLHRCMPSCLRERIAVEVIGRKDRLPQRLLRAVEQVERATANGGRRLRIAFDYSSRHAIVEAARSFPENGDEGINLDALGARLGGKGRVCDVDLLIRTGNEQRLSDFMLWECAFAELYFSDLHWPDFDAKAFQAAIAWYGRRERRMGR